MRLTILLVACGVRAGINGNQMITTHDYLAVKSYLDQNPVFCGIPGSRMDLSRITAVQGLTQAQCGTCLRISGGGKDTYVMAVDKGGVGLDLNTNSFDYLFGEDSGKFPASWEPTDQSNCSDIVKGSNNLPAMQGHPPPTSPIAIPPVAVPIKPTSTCTSGVSWTKCESPGEFSVCTLGSSFIMACPSGKRCSTVNDMAYCM